MSQSGAEAPAKEPAPLYGALELRILWTPGEDVLMEGDGQFQDYELLMVLEQCRIQVTGETTEVAADD